MSREKEIANIVICSKCEKPKIIWQPWRNKFRCVWCGMDYTKKEVQKLKQLSPEKQIRAQYKKTQIVNESLKGGV